MNIETETITLKDGRIITVVKDAEQVGKLLNTISTLERELNEASRKLEIQTQMSQTLAKALDQWREVARQLGYAIKENTVYRWPALTESAVSTLASFEALEKEAK